MVEAGPALTAFAYTCSSCPVAEFYQHPAFAEYEDEANVDRQDDQPEFEEDYEREEGELEDEGEEDEGGNQPGEGTDEAELEVEAEEDDSDDGGAGELSLLILDSRSIMNTAQVC